MIAVAALGMNDVADEGMNDVADDIAPDTPPPTPDCSTLSGHWLQTGATSKGISG